MVIDTIYKVYTHKHADQKSETTGREELGIDMSFTKSRARLEIFLRIETPIW